MRIELNGVRTNLMNANITKITAPDSGELSFTYDGSLPLSQTWSGVGAGTISGTVSQTYNTDFMVNQQCINDSSCVNYQYDLDNLLTTAGELTISREIQKAGLINGSTLDNITMVRTNSSFGEMSAEITTHNTTTLLSANYLRDKLGRITERTLDIQGTTSTDVYNYNDAGRLASVTNGTNGSITTSYVFDDNGNRLSKAVDDGVTSSVVNGTYDEQDRLTSYGNCSYQYSQNGELQQKVCTTGEVSDITSYIYDVLGNLMQVTLANGDKIDYLIDGLNRRIGKKVNGILIQGFLYGDQLNPIAELDSDNNIVSQFIYGTKVNVPDYMVKDGVTYKIITDQLGSPRLVVNASTGEVAQQLDFDEFGLITQDTNPNFQPFGFAGGLLDNHTGLTRFGARDYDAVTGRWTSKDPIRFAGGDSNIYGYVFSDPVNFLDPSGLAYIAERPLGFTNWAGVWVGRVANPLGQWTNTDLVHQQIFFEDADGGNTGKTTDGNMFWSDSIEHIETLDSEIAKYEKILTGLDDGLMREAVTNVGKRGKYCLIGGNCQSYIDKVLDEYNRLEKKKEEDEQCS